MLPCIWHFGYMYVSDTKNVSLSWCILCSLLDPFVKLQMISGQKVIKTKKTSTKKNTLDPVFNETFSFHVTPSSLSDVSLLVSIWDYNTKSRDYFTGQIIMGKFASGNLREGATHPYSGIGVCSVCRKYSVLSEEKNCLDKTQRSHRLLYEIFQDTRSSHTVLRAKCSWNILSLAFNQHVDNFPKPCPWSHMAWYCFHMKNMHSRGRHY